MNLSASFKLFNTPAGRTTLAYFAAFITLGMTSASLGPTLDALAVQTSAGIQQISWLFPVRSFGYLMGSFLAGRLYDRMNGHRLMGFALILMAGMMAFIPTLPLFAILLAVLLAAGVGEGLLDVGGNTLIVWLHGKRVGPYMSALHFFFGFGALLAPLVVGEVVRRTDGITWAYYLIALAALPALIGVAGTKSPENRQDEAEEGPKPITEPGPGLLLLLVVFFIMYVAAEVSYGGWIYLYAIRAASTPPVTAAFITSAFWGAFTVGRLVAIPISARLRPKHILQMDVGGALVSLGVVLTWPQQTWALWAGSIGFGFFIASIFPTMITYAGSRIAVTGRITGYFFLGATLGGMILPWLIGQYFEKTGPLVMPWSIFGAIALAALSAAGVSQVFKRYQSAL